MIREGEIGEAGFDELAQGVFAHQFACNGPYRLFCERRGATPETVGSWEEIPAVPTDAFKAAALVCGDPAWAAATFRTSGTTAGAERRGTHYMPELALYDAALRAGFRAHLLPDGARPRFVSLVPRADEVHDSSLSHMAAEVIGDFGGEGSGYFISADFGIAHEALAGAVAAAEGPVCVLGTAFALVHALDAMVARGERFQLPQGSRVMDTGGFKGRSREVTRAELYGAIQERLGIAPEWCVNEYGMTEMSSQFYDGAAGSAPADPSARLHAGPAWVRTRATDPETLRILPHGEVGVLRHWDLANLGSVACIQTSDLGVTSPGGFRVLGRAQGAEARGCSLAMDDLLSALRER
ncbi:MAG: Long-chain-fatty-acid--luciferin-component ligase [uncultured Gemmatimonadetes bacterium]|uniref:Long-chain-fatty-acid--luciferin-component ligase n=1 Tax=uncultured Gemmatimonadota bacterium TaxID=203437 RepID=A0A6J4MKV1_9BACT|nr:MAG: Long-chain-fatty-acid--luciferin-component ligase [uncultured Gemmatimonadota bacterium]